MNSLFSSIAFLISSYFSDSIRIKKNVELHLEKGAHLKASADINSYIRPCETINDPKTALVGNPVTGKPSFAFIYGYKADGCTISGEGTIDGNCYAFVERKSKYYVTGNFYPRPTVIYIENSNNITVKNVTIIDAPFWTLHPAGCDDVMISNIRILNPLDVANSDGIDPDHCSNVRIIGCHVTCADDCICLKASKGNSEYVRIKNKNYRYMSKFHATVTLIDGTMYIAVVGVGAYFMHAGLISPGDFTASLLLVSTLLGSIRSIVDFSEQFSRGITGIERFADIMDEEPGIADSPDAVEIKDVQGEIEFKDVWFAYKPGEWVLKGVSFHVEPKQTVAFVGSTGSGKTTILSLMVRNYDIQKGQILIDREECEMDADELMMVALDAGAEDFAEEDDSFEITTTPDDFETVRKSLEDAGIPMASAEVSMIPQTYVTLTDETDLKNINKILDLLDAEDDVQEVYHNWDE